MLPLPDRARPRYYSPACLPGRARAPMGRDNVANEKKWRLKRSFRPLIRSDITAKLPFLPFEEGAIYYG